MQLPVRIFWSNFWQPVICVIFNFSQPQQERFAYHSSLYFCSYPMALTLYGELCEIMLSNADATQRTEQVYNSALYIVQTRYNDFHALPYSGKGHFCLRQGRCKEAIKCYAKAAQITSK